MKKKRFTTGAMRCLGGVLLAGALACGGQPEPAVSVVVDEAVSGQGPYRFRVKYRTDHLPPSARYWLGGVHGGFAVDRRPDRGEVYFAIAGAGIVRLAGDLRSASMVPTDDAMKMHPMHNTTVWYTTDGEPRLAFPSVDTEQVFITELNGSLLHVLEEPPSGFEFSDNVITRYFESDGEFKPTDIAHLNEALYIPTGYSELDYVLTAGVHAHGHPHDHPHPHGQELGWQPLGFGGRGDAPGQFWTAHGIAVDPGGDRLSVTDRLHSQIDRFTPDGVYLESVDLPEGSQPCDIDYAYGLAVVACLVGPDRDRGAPIYLLENDRIVSTIMPMEELGLEKFKHVHHAVLHRVDNRLYIIALAWMPGDFAILEQVAN